MWLCSIPCLNKTTFDQITSSQIQSLMTSKQEKMNSALKTFSLYKDLEPFKVFYIYFLKKPFLKRDFIYYFQREGKGRGMGNINSWKIHWLVASHMPLTGDLACNPGMCPDWELNRWPFSWQTCAQSTEPHHTSQGEKVWLLLGEWRNFMQQVLKRLQQIQWMETVFKFRTVNEWLSRPKSRTRAMGHKLQSVRFWLIKTEKSCPANGLKRLVCTVRLF